MESLKLQLERLVEKGKPLNVVNTCCCIQEVSETLKEMGWEEKYYSGITQVLEETFFTKDNQTIILTSIYNDRLIILCKYDNELTKDYLEEVVEEAKEDGDIIELECDDEFSKIAFTLQELGFEEDYFEQSLTNYGVERDYYFGKEGEEDRLNLRSNGSSIAIEWV
mgnify:FL=1